MPDLKIEHVTEKELESIKENLIQPFKLLNSPLYRFRIFETESCIYVFMDFHHIFSDGESIVVVMRDFSDAYHGRVLPRDNAYLFLRDTQKHFLNGDYEKAHAWNLKKFSGKAWVRNITPDMESRNNHASSLTAPFPRRSKERTYFTRRAPPAREKIFGSKWSPWAWLTNTNSGFSAGFPSSSDRSPRE